MIEQVNQHGYIEPEVIRGECAECGQEFHQGEEVVCHEPTDAYLCSDDCVVAHMLKNDYLARVVLE